MKEVLEFLNNNQLVVGGVTALAILTIWLIVTHHEFIFAWFEIHDDDANFEGAGMPIGVKLSFHEGSYEDIWSSELSGGAGFFARKLLKKRGLDPYSEEEHKPRWATVSVVAKCEKYITLRVVSVYESNVAYRANSRERTFKIKGSANAIGAWIASNYILLVEMVYADQMELELGHPVIYRMLDRQENDWPFNKRMA